MGQLVTFAGGNTVLSESLSFKWRDPARVELAIYPNATSFEAVELLNASALQIGLKSTASNTGPLIVNSDSWTWDADELVYYTALNFNTYQLARLFVGASALNSQTGTSYTLALTDATRLVTLANASAITLTVPANASVAFATGAIIYLLRASTGVPTITPAVGVTLTYEDDRTAAMSQAVVYKLVKTGTDAWTVSIAPEAATVSLNLEITGIDGDSSQTLGVTVVSDVVRGDENSPINSENPDNYYTKGEADAAFLTQIEADARYLQSVPSEYLTQTEGDARYLQSVPSEYLTQTEGDARYLQSVPSEYLTQTEGDARYLQSIADGSITSAKLATVSGVAGTVRVKSLVINDKGQITGYKVKYSASITATKSIGATTADQDAFTLTIPANVLEAGDIIDWDMFGTTTNGATASSFLTWVKINGTKSTAVTHAMGTSAASNVGWHMTGKLWVESIYSVRCSFKTSWKLTQGFSVNNPYTVALNTVGITITPGCNFSVATGVSGVIHTACAAMQ